MKVDTKGTAAIQAVKASPGVTTGGGGGGVVRAGEGCGGSNSPEFLQAKLRTTPTRQPKMLAKGKSEMLLGSVFASRLNCVIAFLPSSFISQPCSPACYQGD